jgi:hypothetical protein
MVVKVATNPDTPADTPARLALNHALLFGKSRNGVSDSSPVTPEVAGSSPVDPATSANDIKRLPGRREPCIPITSAVQVRGDRQRQLPSSPANAADQVTTAVPGSGRRRPFVAPFALGRNRMSQKDLHPSAPPTIIPSVDVDGGRVETVVSSSDP